MNLGEGFQQLLGPEEPDRPLLPERQLADRLPTAVRGSGLVALCDNIPSIHPSIYSIPGTTFHYERKYKNSKARGPLTLFAPESIRALGPTTEALFIVVSIVIIGIESSRDLEFTTINF